MNRGIKDEYEDQDEYCLTYDRSLAALAKYTALVLVITEVQVQGTLQVLYFTNNLPSEVGIGEPSADARINVI